MVTANLQCAARAMLMVAIPSQMTRRSKAFTPRSGFLLVARSVRCGPSEIGSCVMSCRFIKMGSESIIFNQPGFDVGLQGPAGGPQYTWQYDDNQARIKEIQTIASGAMAGTRTTWRAHPDNAGALSFEHEDNAPTVPSAANPDVDQSRHYLSVGGQTIAVLVTEGPLPTLGASAKTPPSITTVVLRKVEYWHTDHLGSVIATSNHLGYITARASYDPFGQRRAPTGEADPTQSIELDWDPALNRRTGNGFTGHEHLDDVGIVHMNGRIYDPRLGVFLQPDPLIQSPNNLQNYNRYGYCYNGPLNCSDPTGYFSLRKFLGGAILSVLVPPWGTYIVAREVANSQVGYQIGSIVITIGSFYCGPSAPLCNAGGQAAWAGFSGASAESAVKVGARAGLSTYANQLIGGIDNPGWNVTAHAAWGCAEGKLAGGSCGAGARGAFVSSLIGDGGTIGDPQANFGDLVASVALHAAAGGLASMAGGGNFAQGAQSAAYAYLFNELMHSGYGGSSRDRLRRAGYAETPYDDGTYCNIQSAGGGACGFPGASGDSSSQAGGSAGWSAGIGLGASYELAGMRGSNGQACLIQSHCVLAGPFAGYAADFGGALSSGSPGPGLQVGVFGKAAFPLLGFELAATYGSDGAGLQLGKSFGQMYGGGVKVCVQSTVSCSGPK